MDYKELAEDFMRNMFRHEPPLSQPEDISRGEAGILSFLTIEKDCITAGDLSKELNLSSGRIAIALKSLEKKGFIKRQRAADDKRKVIVKVTDGGRERAIIGHERCLTDTIKLFEYLGEHDAKEFVRITKKIHGIIE